MLARFYATSKTIGMNHSSRGKKVLKFSCYIEQKDTEG